MAPRTPEEDLVENVAQMSAGSVGHPHHCAGACRYIKRKGGCRDGARCPHCHLCFWSRGAENDVANSASVRPAAPVSIGTRGHPHSCSAPCKYARRKGGCRDGADCRNCHVCVWSRGDTAAASEPPEQREQHEQSEQDGSGKACSSTEEIVKEAGADEKPCMPPAFFGQSSGTLQELITALLHEKLG